MIIYIMVDNDGRLTSCSTTPFGDNEEFIKIYVENFSDIFENIDTYRYVNGVLIKSKSLELEIHKKRKDEELNDLCNQYISHGFIHEINGNNYLFPFNIESQLNFENGRYLLENNLIPHFKWTVQEENGQWVRVDITKEDLVNLSLAIFNHKEIYLSKYRDTLIPMIESATTIKEVENIIWDIETEQEQ